MNIKAGLCRQLPGLEAALARGVPGGCPSCVPCCCSGFCRCLSPPWRGDSSPGLAVEAPWRHQGGAHLHPRAVCVRPPAPIRARVPPTCILVLPAPTHGCPSLPVPTHALCLLLGTPVPHLHPWGRRGRWQRRGAAISQARPRGSRCSARWHRTCPWWLGTAGGCLGTGGGCLGTAGCRAWRRLPDSSFITAASPGHGGKARLVLNWKINLGSYTSTAPALAPGGEPGSPHRSCAPAERQHPQDGETEAGRRDGAGGSRASGPIPAALPGAVLLLYSPAVSIGAPRAAACLLIYLFATPAAIDFCRGGRPPAADGLVSSISPARGRR